MLARYDSSRRTQCAVFVLLAIALACERDPGTGPSPMPQPPRPGLAMQLVGDVGQRADVSPVAILDALGAATPSTQFSVFGAGGASVSSFQLAGPEFTLTEPTDITEIGAFLNNCESILDGVPQCPGTLPLTVQIRPSANGVPHPSIVLGSFVLSHDNDPLVISYESVALELTLIPGTYFALFGAQGNDGGALLDNATIPFTYQAGSINLGFFFPSTGSSVVQPNVPGAVRILGTPSTGGAIVTNSGEGKPDVSCSFGQFTTTQGTAVRSPSGNATLSCQFDNLPQTPAPEILTGWLCTIIHGGVSETRHSQWVRSPSGSATVTCQFSGKPLNDAAVTFGSNAAAAEQGAFTAPLGDVPGQHVTRAVVDIGRACNADQLTGDPSGKIALIARGFCTFSEKLTRAQNAGAVAAIVYNNAGEEIITMGGAVSVSIPGVFVARSTGLALQAAAPTEVTITYCGRSASCRGAFEPAP